MNFWPSLRLEGNPHLSERFTHGVELFRCNWVTIGQPIGTGP
jgi:hypothetical protein